MKIILSPSKTQNFDNTYSGPVTEPHFIKEANILNNKLQRLSNKKIAATMKIDGPLLEETLYNIKNFDILPASPAVYTYTGLVYKYMNLSDYTPEMIHFMNQHLIILSAMYGLLKPMDGIKPYRLDMKMTIMTRSLYDYWAKKLTTELSEETIIDLASDEFSKMVPLPKISIGFRQLKDNKYKNMATYSKMARGQLLDIIIKHQIDDMNTLKNIAFDGYTYDEKQSKDTILIYSRDYIK